MTNRRAQAGEAIPDPISHRDLVGFWLTARERLLVAIDNGHYTPQQVEIVDLPKDLLTVRPLARMNAIDRITYEACVFALQPRIDDYIPRSVYSYRWSTKRSQLLSSVRSWVAMQRRGRTIARSSPHLMLAKTDISSFYEHVDVRMLCEEVSELTGHASVMKVLRAFLDRFGEDNQVWGLPQGSDASGILANAYLLPVDRYLQNRGLNFLRYSDDLYIFGDNWNSLRRELIQITQILRGRKLHLAGSKTRIVAPAEALGQFEEAEKDAIKYGLHVGFSGTDEALSNLFHRATSDPREVDDRDLRFCLNLFKQRADPLALTWLLHNFDAVPQAAREAVTYLGVFVDEDQRVLLLCQRLLEENRLADYPYAEMHVLRLLLSVDRGRTQHLATIVWRILEDRNRPGFVREYAARFAGLNARPGDAALLRTMLKSENDPKLRRALLVASYESGGTTRSWLEHPSRNTQELRMTSELLLRSPKLPITRE
ncbi:RNA-directed DNA polymerase [Motilibacter sp. E257]|uniref:RNA-directed DNA polymerase n=1 Tax=Motilibacter deserti TaxID=2714956 RepID=A0ABX0GWG1_9ACTN|nr:RNA-directed DNA polymerase [Motilibacter deserti]